MGKVYIMRGIPGVGKSTYVDNFSKGHPELKVSVCSADHYFMKDGEYKFDPTKLVAAHGECLRTFLRMITILGPDVVFVDNTNIRAVEIAPYYALAVAYGWEAQINTLLGDPEKCSNRNIHGVPESTVLGMFQIMQEEEGRFPPYWSHYWADFTSREY